MLISLLICYQVAAVSASEDRHLVSIGGKELGLTLDAQRGYALKEVWNNGSSFKSGGDFPCFVLFNDKGTEQHYPACDSRWKVGIAKTKNGAKVTYSQDGFSADVLYETINDMLVISVLPRSESATLKIRAISNGGSLLSIPSDSAGAESSGFLIRPKFSGELIRFPANRESRRAGDIQSWEYQASFFGLGYNGHGLIVRCPQYGAVWIAGTGELNGVYSLFGGLTADFRPRRDLPRPYLFPKMPLVEKRIDIQLVPVGDTNGDGNFNWVDIGVAYRQRFIKRNRHLDKSDLISVGGKVNVAAPQAKNPLNYRQLIEQIRAIDFAPQRWWLVGAHVPKGNDFTAPPYSDYPPPTLNGPDGYDYLAFKKDAAKAGAKIGLHEIFQDVCPLNKQDWGKVTLRMTEMGGPMGTWGGNTPSGVVGCVSKSIGAMLKDGSFCRDLDQHFKHWNVNDGDTWHWDCFTAFGGRSDFSDEHPATHGSDIRSRIEILKYITGKGIHMTSEGLQEGMAEYCTFSWSAKTEPGWSSAFAAGEPVPLVPVLFQGMTYYSVSWYPAWNLLFGGKVGYEAVSIDREALVGGYFSNIAYWSKIADRTVKNMVKTTNGWKVQYTEGGSLTVDLANMTPAMTFVLEVDGMTYTSENPPASPWGVTAKLVDGKYMLTYPPKEKGQ
ncbi:MAG: hypothetical protein JXM70_18410 [Pirellulales bacterium]|nr:hypothetical protein [Pirellulales bacterium]